MFEPNTYWERRAASLEALLLQLIDAADMQGLLGPWYQQIEVMKSFRVEQVLGPVTLEEANAATNEFIFTRVPLKLMELGLVEEVIDPSIPMDDPVRLIESNKRESRILSLPDLDGVMGPDAPDGVYRIALPNNQVACGMLLRYSDPVNGDLLNFFIVGGGGMHSLSLSLKNMPSTFSWKTDQQFWRSELYQYRGDMPREDFVHASDAVFKKIDFTELNAEMDAAVAQAQANAEQEQPEVTLVHEDVVAADDEPVLDTSPVIDPPITDNPPDWFDTAKNPEDR